MGMGYPTGLEYDTQKLLQLYCMFFVSLTWLQHQSLVYMLQKVADGRAHAQRWCCIAVQLATNYNKQFCIYFAFCKISAASFCRYVAICKMHVVDILQSATERSISANMKFCNLQNKFCNLQNASCIHFAIYNILQDFCIFFCNLQNVCMCCAASVTRFRY